MPAAAASARGSGKVADDPHLAVRRDTEVRADDDPAGAIGFETEVGAERDRPHPRSPYHRAGCDRLPAGQMHRAGDNLVNRAAQPHLDAPSFEHAPGVAAEAAVERGQQPLARLDQDDPRPAQVEAGVVLGQHPAEQLGEGPRHLHAGRSATGDDDIELAVEGDGPLGVGELELAEEVAAQGQGVVEGLESEGVLLNAGDTEGRRLGAGREDQLVVGDRRPFGDLDDALVEIDVGHGAQPDVDVDLAMEDASHGVGDRLALQAGGCDLVEQGLEGVEVLAVDQRDPHRLAGERLSQGEASEAGTDDDDVLRGSHRLSIALGERDGMKDHTIM